MKAYASLWSADLLALGGAVAEVEELVAGFHIDVFDGHNVPELLFGPDLVARLRGATSAVIDVHLNVTEPDYWVDRFADAGADVITVQAGPCADPAETLAHIRERGVRAGLGVELHEDVRSVRPVLPVLDRLLLLGTEIGVKGRGLDPGTPERVREAVELRRDSAGASFELDVDGGIRRHTVAQLASAGADGIVPGSLVFGAADPRAVLGEIAALRPGQPLAEAAPFWSTEPVTPA